MYIVYTNEEPPESYSKSIFLAGPTPRTPNVKSWRPEALVLLEAAGYDGVVFVPEFRPRFEREYRYPDMPAWEHRMLDMADCILFWIPRELKKMPAFTTNIELGLYARSEKVVMGSPVGAEKMKYPIWLADKFRIPQSRFLNTTINNALNMIGDGALRSGGEREVPFQIWRTPSFKSWLNAQKQAGNRLDGAKVEWVFKVGRNKDIVFYWAIHANIYIASENRNKINEIVLSRFDISSIVMYQPAPDIFDTKIILVREFRSPARTRDGFIWELPGGSAHEDSDPSEIILAESSEEVGIKLNPARLVSLQSRQLAGTFSSHKANLFSYELMDYELKILHGQENIPHGADLDNPTGERAWTKIVTLRDILNDKLVDWSNLGMICLTLMHSPEPLFL